jgi:hypothetical protein
MNQILTQKWFLLQNIKDTFVMVFSITKNGHNVQSCCLFGRVSTKIFKFKLKQVYATRNTFLHS